jgi:hypothetical protein
VKSPLYQTGFRLGSATSFGSWSEGASCDSWSDGASSSNAVLRSAPLAQSQERCSPFPGLSTFSLPSLPYQRAFDHTADPRCTGSTTLSPGKIPSPDGLRCSWCSSTHHLAMICAQVQIDPRHAIMTCWDTCTFSSIATTLPNEITRRHTATGCSELQVDQVTDLPSSMVLTAVLSPQAWVQ